MSGDAERLAAYVEAWRSAVDDVVVLLRGLTDDEWHVPTDLPGWDVHAVAAHLAHLESVLSGAPQPEVEVPDAPHLTARSSRATEAGVLARRDRTPAEVVDEIVAAASERLRQLRERPPTDGSAEPPVHLGAIAHTWEALLRNRVLDVWLHEQDVRRAVGRPGGMSSAAATHSLSVLTLGIPYVVGKRVAPAPGTTVVLDVTGVSPIHLAVEVDERGRATPLSEEPPEPSARLTMDLETFVVLSGGRRPPEDLPVKTTGDDDLARRVMSAMAVTP